MDHQSDGRESRLPRMWRVFSVPAFVKITTRQSEPTVSPIELVLNQRRLLRVRPGFDADMLLELVRLLEEPAC